MQTDPTKDDAPIMEGLAGPITAKPKPDGLGEQIKSTLKKARKWTKDVRKLVGGKPKVKDKLPRKAKPKRKAKAAKPKPRKAPSAPEQPETMAPATLVAIRTREGLSQVACAAKLGVDRVTLARWETGTTAISRASAALIRETFGIRT